MRLQTENENDNDNVCRYIRCGEKTCFSLNGFASKQIDTCKFCRRNPKRHDNRRYYVKDKMGKT